MAIGGIRGNESQATQAGLWQLGGGILRLHRVSCGSMAAWRKRTRKLNGVREVMTMAKATGSENDGGGHDSSDDVGQW